MCSLSLSVSLKIPPQNNESVLAIGQETTPMASWRPKPSQTCVMAFLIVFLDEVLSLSFSLSPFGLSDNGGGGGGAGKCTLIVVCVYYLPLRK